MAIVKQSAYIINADFFDKSKPVNEWPAGIIVNAKSKSGYSYKTMNELPTLEPGNKRIDGFGMPDKHWLLVDNIGNAWIENDDDFKKKYSF